jgi:hypothetical protein
MWKPEGKGGTGGWVGVVSGGWRGAGCIEMGKGTPTSGNGVLTSPQFIASVP